jgi:hypothetical protein
LEWLRLGVVAALGVAGCVPSAQGIGPQTGGASGSDADTMPGTSLSTTASTDTGASASDSAEDTSSTETTTSASESSATSDLPGDDDSGADETGSDETGSDETGSDETGSDETGSDTTGSETLAAYGPCIGGETCRLPEEFCLVASGTYHICTQTCDAVEDCPAMPPGGTATLVCGPTAGQAYTACWMNCSPGECPGNMVCNPNGRCTWSTEQ